MTDADHKITPFTKLSDFEPSLIDPFKIYDVYFWGTQKGYNYTHRSVPTPPQG